MQFYRYVKPADEHYLRAGSLLLSSTRSCAKLEDQRADDLEGAVRGTIKNQRMGQSEAAASQPLQRYLRAAGVSIEDCGSSNISLQVENRDSGYAIFCLSHTASNTHWLSSGLTCVWEVVDHRDFAENVRRSCASYLGMWESGPVSYAEREFSGLDPLPEADPFIKRPRFAPEDEYRIVWRKLPGAPDRVKVSLFPRLDLMRKVR